MSAESSPEKTAPAETTETKAPPVVRRKGGSGWALAVGVVAIIVVAGVLAAYEEHWIGPAPAKPLAACPTGNALQGEGAALISPLMSAWDPAYGTATQNSVNYNPAGSGAGITALTEKQVDFAASDAPLDPAQTTGLPSPAETLPVTTSALAIIYNVPGVGAGLNLTGPILAAIYSGTITSWNATAIAAINPGVALPGHAITTVHRSDSAGATYVLTNYLSDASHTWKTGPGTGLSISWPTTPSETGQSGNSKMLSYVSGTTYTIGYTDLSDAKATSGLNYAAVQNSAGNYIVPTADDTSSAVAHVAANTTFPASGGNWSAISMVNASGAHDYPLATLIYFFVYANLADGYQPTLAKSQAVHQWLSWVLTSGQSVSATYNYGALPSTVIATDDAGLSALSYNGEALPACQ